MIGAAAVRTLARVTMLVATTATAVGADGFSPEDSISCSFTPREERSRAGVRTRLAGRFGDRRQVERVDTTDREPAVEDGLAWLVRSQAENGSWGGPLETGLALFALFDDGQSVIAGEYEAAVKLGIHWLKRTQDRETGQLGAPDAEGSLEVHAIAALALCEMYAVSRSPLQKGSCQRAVDFLQRHALPSGGWSRELASEGGRAALDPRTSAWALEVLRTADLSRLKVDEGVVAVALAVLGGTTTPELALRFAYQSEPLEDPELVGAVSMWLEPSMRGGPVDPESDFLRICALAGARSLAPDAWEDWRRERRLALLGCQEVGGADLGSWYPPCFGRGDPSRVEATAYALLSLQLLDRRSVESPQQHPERARTRRE